ncbi:MAG: putative modification methylase [Prokaryotic dsDNA virus sp.]|nr:MAG: putative modification methylase [Prokaryotic dsDNA virus sp.]
MRLICGDSMQELSNLDPCSIDAVVCDPPYGLGQTTPAQVSSCLQAWSMGETWKPKGSGFMGKSWDSWVPPPELWKEVIRVLKPGGHLIAFAGSRTQDLMSISLRLAGFEVRDTIQWLYGSGFPKSLNIGKAIDKIQGNEREVIGRNPNSRENCDKSNSLYRMEMVGKTAYITKGSSEYEGYGTALKPAFEPAILCRKPLDGTVAHNVLKHGVGGLNIDGCRIETDEDLRRTQHEVGMWSTRKHTHTTGGLEGRWPSNVIMDEQVECGEWKRFFYCAKASRQEREQGLDGHGSRVNIHPTVKPIDLMRYLCRLITPRNGIILDPFLGSGSTGIAAGLEGFDFVGIEREEEYFEIAKARIEHWTNTLLTYDQPQPKETKVGEQLSLF